VDLVRNEVFSRVADDPGEAKRLFEHVWQPFQAKFEGRSESFFFPYCLIHDSNTKKTELFSQLREIWEDLTPDAVVAHMEPYRIPYMAVDNSPELIENDCIKECLLRLQRLRRPTATYPFLMRLLYEFRNGTIEEAPCVAVLEGVESFLVRRAIVGYEPTGLHALFKSLWDEIGELSAAGLATVVATKPTIQWPGDEAVRSAVLTRALAESKICGYLLVEYDRSLPGDHPPVEPSIEHILPQSFELTGPWADAFTRDKHKEVKDTLANLVPLSSPLNSSLQAIGYTIKRERYQRESMFVTPRHVADEFEQWTPEALATRARSLADWAVSRWPHSPS
jgi:hypothetical protein